MIQKLIIGLILLPLFAFSQDLTKLSTSKLMEDFWRCHYISDQTEGSGQRFPDSLLESCSLISKEVQVRVFKDDFNAMHQWTLKNKPSSVSGTR